MNFETAEQTAQRLGVTKRAVQKWAKDGKIPLAEKKSGVWMIPNDAVTPSSRTQSEERSYINPFPSMELVHSDNADIYIYIYNIANEDERNMAQSEYYYFTGRFEEATAIAEPYLDSKNSALRSAAALFCMFSNLCAGHILKAHYAEEILKEQLDSSLKFKDPKNAAVHIFSELIMRMQLHLSINDTSEIDDYIKHFSGGMKLMALYVMAYTAYHRKEYDRALGIIDTALVLTEERYVIPVIYLYILGSMAHINLRSKKKAERCIEKAWEIASSGGFIMPFVEHYSLLQGFADKLFKKKHPEAYKEIITLANKFNASWYKVYNNKNINKVAENLTHTEFTIAMLYSRNWRVKEIAEHMELSERTINNYISVIYDKLGINNKKMLENFILK